MALDEIKMIKALDVDSLQKFADKLWFFFAQKDPWVGEHVKDIIRAFPDPDSIRVVQAKQDMPHEFSISMYPCVMLPLSGTDEGFQTTRTSSPSSVYSGQTQSFMERRRHKRFMFTGREVNMMSRRSFVNVILYIIQDTILDKLDVAASTTVIGMSWYTTVS